MFINAPVCPSFDLLRDRLMCLCLIRAGIPGDGRCLFRSVVHGACLRTGKPSPSESLEKELADELRHKVLSELNFSFSFLALCHWLLHCLIWLRNVLL